MRTFLINTNLTITFCLIGSILSAQDIENRAPNSSNNPKNNTNVLHYLTLLNGIPVTKSREERSITEINGRAALVTQISEVTRMRVRSRSYHVETTTERVEWADTLEAVSLKETRSENGSVSVYTVNVNAPQYTVKIQGRQNILYRGDIPPEGLYFRLDGEVLKKRSMLRENASMTGYVIVAEEGSLAYLQVLVSKILPDGFSISVSNVKEGGTGWEEECTLEGITRLVEVGGVSKRLVPEAEARLPVIAPAVSNTLEALGHPENLYKRRSLYVQVTLPGGEIVKMLPDSMYSTLIRKEGDETAFLKLTSTYADGTLPEQILSADDYRQYLSQGRLFELDHPTIQRALEQALEEAADVTPLAHLTAIVRWTSRRLQGGRAMPAMASAAEAISGRGGDCTEYAVSVVALLRKAGIPARMALGLVFDGKAFQFHAWAEAYIEKCWIPADASYKRVGFPPAYIFLGYSDGGMGDYETRAMNLISGGSIQFLNEIPLENGGTGR